MSLRAYDRLRLALTAIGAGISAYLTLLHYDSHVPLVCSGGPLVNCEQVLTSPSSIVLGVPVAAYGLVWFAVAVVLAVRSLRVHGGLEPPRLRAAGLAWTALGTLSVLWLIYQELGVVGKICAWCTAVHLIVIAVLVLQVLSDPLRTGQGPASG